MPGLGTHLLLLPCVLHGELEADCPVSVPAQQGQQLGGLWSIHSSQSGRRQNLVVSSSPQTMGGTTPAMLCVECIECGVEVAD